MRTVWIVKDGGHYYEAAKEFGEIKELFEGNYSFPNTSLLLNVFNDREVKEDDLILLSGPLFYNALIAFYWPYQAMNVLVFNAKTKTYVERRFDVGCNESEE